MAAGSKYATKITLPSDREITITRSFNAPRERVFDAMTRPELLRRWLLGPPGWTMTECEVDLRVGGAYRYAWSGPDGAAMAMHGVFREIDPPGRIANTETFDLGCEHQSGENFGTAVLTEKDGKTTLELTVLYPSKEARDGMIESGMEQGVAAGHERLDKVLAGEAQKQV